MTIYHDIEVRIACTCNECGSALPVKKTEHQGELLLKIGMCELCRSVSIAEAVAEALDGAK